ncbi:TPA: hypothetical protein HA278_04280 [Candidatus Woesearchaeota archaeon]|jgi:hypothetical protein|nr:hypothetical protein [Candidatus Woesearchaeota archaeon]|tara:strand:+ start:1152 stop:1346 length:195 start_codon:yes stop_codon:yes gene_type:complete
MNKATLIKQLEGVSDDAEIFMHPNAESNHYVQCESMTTVDENEQNDVDEDGNVIPAGSVLLFTA